MAPKKETLFNKMIANMSTNIIMQIILLLILLSHVSNAFNWECWGASMYALTFQNKMADDTPGYDINEDELIVRCTSDDIFYKDQVVKPKPEATFTFNDGWIFGRSFNCTASLAYYDWEATFKAFNSTIECKKDKHCIWQLRRKHPYLYDSKHKQWVQQEYVYDPYNDDK